jgi:antitoxin component of MazEF toxin-antitoxin module
MFKQKTKISKGTTNNNSVRTTVPAPIAQMIDVKAGDSIEWTVESNNDKISVTITKVIE